MSCRLDSCTQGRAPCPRPDFCMDAKFIAQWADKPPISREQAMSWPTWGLVALVGIVFAGVMVASALS